MGNNKLSILFLGDSDPHWVTVGQAAAYYGVGVIDGRQEPVRSLITAQGKRNESALVGAVVCGDDMPATVVSAIDEFELEKVPVIKPSEEFDQALDELLQRATQPHDRTADAPFPVVVEPPVDWDFGSEPQAIPVVATADDGTWDFGPGPQQPTPPVEPQPAPAPPAPWQQPTPPVEPQPAPAPPAPWQQPTPSLLPAVVTPPPTSWDPGSIYDHKEVGLSPQGPFVIFVASGKGGVGKTTTAMAIAALAASAGIPTCLIDANRGQGDVRTFMRFGSGARVKNVGLAAVSGPSSAIMSPAEVAELRHDRLPNLGFSFSAAPPPEVADPRIVGPDVYASVLAVARESNHIVVVDTQISEAFDTTGLWEHFAFPELSRNRGAVLVAVMDGSQAAIENTGRLIGRVRSEMQPPRCFAIINRVTEASDEVAKRRLTDWLRGQGVESVAYCSADQSIEESQQRGGVAPVSTELGEAVREILYELTALPAFERAPKTRWSFRGLRRS